MKKQKPDSIVFLGILAVGFTLSVIRTIISMTTMSFIFSILLFILWCCVAIYVLIDYIIRRRKWTKTRQIN